MSDDTTLVYEEKTDPSKVEEKKAQESKKKESAQQLTQEEQLQVNKLQARDTEVKAHEAAHQGAGGGLSGGASFTYQQGPDGKMYAIGGEVPISFKEGNSPAETKQIAQQVIAAAMAPANPSPQDFAVASSAMMMLIKAQQQEAKETQMKLMGQEVYKNEANNNNLRDMPQSTSKSLEVNPQAS
jgi:hypothetical protein